LKRIEAQATQIATQLDELGRQNFPPLFVIENAYRLALVKAEQSFIADIIGKIENGWGPLELWRGIHQDRDATLAKLYQKYGGAPMS